MRQKKKKISLWVALLGAMISGYGGYLLNGAWENGMDLTDFLAAFNRVCKAPLDNYYNETTVKAVAIALLFYCSFTVCYQPEKLHAWKRIWYSAV